MLKRTAIGLTKPCPPCKKPADCFCDSALRLQEEFEKPRSPEAYIESRWPPGAIGRSAVLSFWDWQKRQGCCHEHIGKDVPAVVREGEQLSL